MLANKLKPDSVEITQPIVQALRSGRQKYEVDLEEEKKKKQKCVAEVRAMHIAADIEKLSFSETKPGSARNDGKRSYLVHGKS